MIIKPSWGEKKEKKKKEKEKNEEIFIYGH